MMLPLLLAAAINPTAFYNSFDHRHPVLARIQPGEVVETRTIDAGGIDEHGKRAGVRGNPLTGPFHIEGAEPGDSIEVRFRKIRTNRDWGFSTFRLGLFSLEPDSIEGLYSPIHKPNSVIEGRDAIVRWRIDRQAGKVRLEDPVSRTITASMRGPLFFSLYTIRVRFCSSAMAMRCKPTASPMGPEWRPRWRSSSRCSFTKRSH